MSPWSSWICPLHAQLHILPPKIVLRNEIVSTKSSKYYWVVCYDLNMAFNDQLLTFAIRSARRQGSVVDTVRIKHCTPKILAASIMGYKFYVMVFCFLGLSWAFMTENVGIRCLVPFYDIFTVRGLYRETHTCTQKQNKQNIKTNSYKMNRDT